MDRRDLAELFHCSARASEAVYLLSNVTRDTKVARLRHHDFQQFSLSWIQILKFVDLYEVELVLVVVPKSRVLPKNFHRKYYHRVEGDRVRFPQHVKVLRPHSQSRTRCALNRMKRLDEFSHCRFCAVANKRFDS